MMRTMMSIVDKWKELVKTANEKGIPLPTVRDPKTSKGSVSLTLVFISFNLCVIGIIGKWAGALGGVDADSAFQLFMACGALYWGRKLSKDDKGYSIEQKVKSEPPKAE
jgi:hypothetical protein